MKPLTIEEASKIGGAINRLAELGQNKVLSPSNDAEKTATTKWLGEQLMAHAQELMGHWFAVETEYKPLLQVISAVSVRVKSTMDRVSASKEIKPAE